MNPFNSIFVVGPVWLMKLLKKTFNFREDMFGIQHLCGVLFTKQTASGRLVPLWKENLGALEDFLEEDLAMGKWLDENKIEQK